MVIIGITGTLGAGKGVIVDYLVKNFDLVHFSVRKYLIEEIEKKNLPVNRDSMVKVANLIRSENSPSFIIDELYKKAKRINKNSVIESIRAEGEVISLRKKSNFYLFAVDADAKLRYQRIKERKSETDNVTFETFIQNEEREMNSKDPNKQNIRKCMQLADYVFENNGTLEELYSSVAKAFNDILLK